MKAHLALAALSCASITAVASADVFVINFDNLTAPAVVTEQYAGMGVHFSSTGAFDSNGGFHNSVEVFGFGFPGYGTNAAGMWGNLVTIDFDMPVSDFSVDIADTESNTLLAVISAYDGNGMYLNGLGASTGGYNTPWFHQRTLGFGSIGGIRRIVLETDADGAVFDNITFTAAAVPGPGAAALVAGGGLLMARRRRR
ncbi:MAG: hypothetical protein ACKVS8_04410 [Phycisphaerales bacterium]